MFEAGSLVVYRKTKHSASPGPRAHAVSPSRFGDTYSYCVDKLWLVVEHESPDRIVVQTRKGKKLELDVNDPNLRPASLLDQIRYWGRFPKQDSVNEG